MKNPAHRRRVLKRVRDISRKWYAQNRKRHCLRTGINSKKNQARRTALAALAKLWRRNNPQKAKQHWKTYRSKHPEVVRARNRAWHALNKKSVSKRHQQRALNYSEAERVVLRKACRAWYRKNRIHKMAKSKARDLRKRGVTVDERGIFEWMLSVKSQPLAMCGYCREQIPSHAIHFDHVVPLARGGLHALENLCVACASCNLSKGKKTLAQWRNDLKRKLK